MNPNTLARALVERLNRVVPADIYVDIEHGEITFAVAGETRQYVMFVEAFERGGQSTDEVERAVARVLDSLQDFVIEEAGVQPWPHPRGLARAGVRVTADEVRMWYGDEADPSLAIEPIPLE